MCFFIVCEIYIRIIEQISQYFVRNYCSFIRILNFSSNLCRCIGKVNQNLKVVSFYNLILVTKKAYTFLV